MSADKSNGNAPAYPWGDSGNRWGGLTKREAFSMAAMQGFAAADPNSFLTMNDAIETAVEWADLLLAELAKDGES